MRHVAAILLVCVLVLGAVLALASLPGAVRFQAGDLSIDAATPVVVVAVLLGLLLFYAAIRGVSALIALPGRLRARRGERRRQRGDTAVTGALVAIAAGQPSDALSHAARARRLLGDTPHTLLLDAQAHGLAGHDDQAQAHYATLADHPEASLLGLRGLLRQATARGDWESAQTLIARAERLHPGSPWLRAEREKIGQQFLPAHPAQTVTPAFTTAPDGSAYR